MSDVERRFHETWLGMVQPIEGLVVSIPVLVDAQCMERQPPHLQQKFLDLCPPSRQGDAGPEGHRLVDLGRLLQDVLGFAEGSFESSDELPEELSLFVPEGKQTLRPTMGLKKQEPPKEDGADTTPSVKAGRRYEMLIWDVGTVAGGIGLDLDRTETVTGPWDYPPVTKFDRLLRHCRVPIGLLTNREVVRLVYAPHGESSGSISFHIKDMVSVGGRPILDAFIMLLSANRFFGVAEERALPALLAESRKRQANVTNDLADQVFEALQILLRGFESAAERDGGDLLDDALAREGDHLYKGLLTVLLRLVFLLYAEDRGLLPVDHPVYAKNLSTLELFDELQADHGAYPDSMSRRFGAWGRLVTLFRAIFLGFAHGDLKMPPRRGSLFNPHEYPFLEGWGPAGSAPITQPEDRAATRLPSVDDETVFRVLEKLLMFEGQRLSYRALDVEQIGSVYEALMGYHVIRTDASAVCMRPDRLWVTAEEVLEVPAARRTKWIKETIGLSAAQAEKLSEELKDAKGSAALEALAKFATGKKTEQALSRAKLGQLVLQPGTERRRTSSHYTPRSLSAPIVRRTLEPLLAVMGDAPTSERILRLKICDPAMGSGAFLVEACRFLADHVLAAWTREGIVEDIAKEHGDTLLHARRLVAQRCLYGVDKNEAAVELAKLSLWLVTLSKNLPFTFLDHSLRHGDSLVGLDFNQIRSFHWKPGKQLDLFTKELDAALEEAIALREKISELAFSDSSEDQREKERLFWDAQDALDRVRLVGDLVVGAFFANDKDKEREKERDRRLDLVSAWLRTGGPPSEEVRAMQTEVRARLPVLHWMVEFPEIFYAERRDPLDGDQVNRAACFDAFIGNPPFLGGTRISVVHGVRYRDWLAQRFDASSLTDLCAFFFRRVAELLGKNGTAGLLATTSVAQGDSRTTGLGWICRRGGIIYDAARSLPWPGTANTSVSIVHFSVGSPRAEAMLDGVRVRRITSYLTTRGSENPPHVLASNVGTAVIGSFVLGVGFLFEDGNEGATPIATKDALAQDPRNQSRIFKYVGGEDLNSHPRQESPRFVIDFGDSTEQEAREWPELFAIVERKVRPARATVQQRDRREQWWRHATRSPVLRDYLSRRTRALAISQVTAHLAFSFIPRDVVISHTTVAILSDAWTTFATLQSRVHEPWARLLSSSLEDRAGTARVRYTPSECLETFPFPRPNPGDGIAALEELGQRVYESRAKYMVDENVGMTVTYNRLKDPSCTDTRIIELRSLHEQMDRAVLTAYAENDPEGRWSEIEVPSYCSPTDVEKKKFEAFEDAVIDRLFALNAKRAEEEKRKGLGGKPAPRARKVPAINTSNPQGRSFDERLRAKGPSSLPLQAPQPTSPTSPLPRWGPDMLVAVGASTGLPLSAGRWANSESGIGLGVSALAAVLRAVGRPASRDEAERAVVLTVLPRLLLAKFDKKSAGLWRKVIGAKNLREHSIAAFSIPWGATLERAVKERLLVVTPDDMWIAGPDVRDAPSPELDARALVSVSWLAHVQAPDVELMPQLEILRAA